MVLVLTSKNFGSRKLLTFSLHRNFKESEPRPKYILPLYFENKVLQFLRLGEFLRIARSTMLYEDFLPRTRELIKFTD